MTKTLKSKFVRLSPDQRLHECPVPIIGITGGIATGKSTFSKMMADKGLCLINADQLIHNIYKRQETLELVKSLVPEAVTDSINFSVLRERFFKDQQLKDQLESFLYNKLPEEFAKAIVPHSQVVLYDVPLLFEKKLDKYVDTSVVVTASRETQLERLQKRDPTSSDETNNNILKQQMPLSQKEKLANIVISNDKGLENLQAQCDSLMKELFEN